MLQLCVNRILRFYIFIALPADFTVEYSRVVYFDAMCEIAAVHSTTYSL